MFSLVGLLINGAIFGLVLAVVLRQEFPGWGVAIGCALAVGVGSAALGFALPEGLAWLDVLGGAAVGMVLVRWLTDASWKGAALVLGVYLGLGFLLRQLF